MPPKKKKKEAKIAWNFRDIEIAESAWESEISSAAKKSRIERARLEAARETAKLIAAQIEWETNDKKKDGVSIRISQPGALQLLSDYLAACDLQHFQADENGRAGAQWLQHREAVRLAWWIGPPFGVASILVPLTKLLLEHWVSVAKWHQHLAFQLVEALTKTSEQLAEHAEKNPTHFRPVAERSLRWPAAFNARSEDAETRKHLVKLFRMLGVASKHPHRGRKRLRGLFASEVETHWWLLVTGREWGFLGGSFQQKVQKLSPLSLANWREWCLLGWELFEGDYGKKWEDHPEVVKRCGKGGAAWERRERVRDSYDSLWKTLARQMAPKDSGKNDSEKSESENPVN